LSHRYSQLGWRRLIGWFVPVVVLIGVPVFAADPSSQPVPAQPASGPSTNAAPPLPGIEPPATQPPSTQTPAPLPNSNPSAVSPDLVGRIVEEIRVTGNAQVPSEVILNQVRTKEHEKFDPAQVEQDYQRIFALKRFSNVEAKVEPTAKGVIVIFDVTEEKLIKSIRFVGNRAIDTNDLRKEIADLQVGEAVDRFRINLARRSIINALALKNFPFAHVDVDMDEVLRTGDLVFNIVEGPPVTIRKIGFIGNKSFDDSRLNDQIKTTRWWWIFNAGTYDMNVVDQDVAILRRYYQSKGFFDVKVGRKLIYSPDQTEMEVDFLIDEGVKYKVGQVKFIGNKSLSDAQLRKVVNLREGDYFDDEILQRDIKEIVQLYSPLGFIYDPRSPDPAYLRIGRPNYPFGILTLVHMQRGVVDLVYEISEGRPMRQGRVIIKGNTDTQQKVILRELHTQPGQLYNSGELLEALDRLRGLPAFEKVAITPIGNEPDTRDVLVEVSEKKTAEASLAATLTSNYGLGGNIGITQRNFDYTAFPTRIDQFIDGTAFKGAGETFRVNFAPGIYATSADVSFTEPYLFDLPYYTTDQAYFSRYEREAWYEQHAGGIISFGKQFNYNLSTSISLGAEDVKIGGIEDYYPPQQRVDILDPLTHDPTIDPVNGQVETQLRSPRSIQILEHQGHNTQTDVGWTVRYDTTNHGPLAYKGINTSFSFKEYGALGAEYHFSQFDANFNSHTTLFSDLLDRKTVFNFHLEGGYITPDAPFFDRYYGGGNGGEGAIRGFQFRGASPRDGRFGDPIGGDLDLVGSFELNFPIYGEALRGVVFTDIGTVESDIRIHSIREGVGAGVRVVIPFLGPTPLAFDVAFPVLKNDRDVTQIFSFGVDIRR
jgi:outer membrane protein insertion porin family